MESSKVIMWGGKNLYPSAKAHMSVKSMFFFLHSSKSSEWSCALLPLM